MHIKIRPSISTSALSYYGKSPSCLSSRRKHTSGCTEPKKRVGRTRGVWNGVVAHLLAFSLLLDTGPAEQSWHGRRGYSKGPKCAFKAAMVVKRMLIWVKKGRLEAQVFQKTHTRGFSSSIANKIIYGKTPPTHHTQTSRRTQTGRPGRRGTRPCRGNGAGAALQERHTKTPPCFIIITMCSIYPHPTNTQHTGWSLTATATAASIYLHLRRTRSRCIDRRHRCCPIPRFCLIVLGLLLYYHHHHHHHLS